MSRSDTPLVPGRIHGIRAWSIRTERGSPRLGALVNDSRWAVGGAATEASCRAVGRGGHRAPREACSCGLYALHPFAARRGGHLASGAVIGVIEAWGRVVLHPTGFRAEYARPVALFSSVRAVGETRTMVERLARAYGADVIEFADRHDIVRTARDRGWGMAESVVAELVGIPPAVGELAPAPQSLAPPKPPSPAPPAASSPAPPPASSSASPAASSPAPPASSADSPAADPPPDRGLAMPHPPSPTAWRRRSWLHRAATAIGGGVMILSTAIAIGVGWLVSAVLSIGVFFIALGAVMALFGWEFGDGPDPAPADLARRHLEVVRQETFVTDGVAYYVARVVNGHESRTALHVGAPIRLYDAGGDPLAPRRQPHRFTSPTDIAAGESGVIGTRLGAPRPRTETYRATLRVRAYRRPRNSSPPRPGSRTRREL